MSDPYAIYRQFGGLLSAAQIALEYLKGGSLWQRESVIFALERALANDGSEDYYSRRDDTVVGIDSRE